jgi:NAD(P)-dependent dehydrogenase (short-subunit alcohol dehydrogenase family)
MYTFEEEDIGIPYKKALIVGGSRGIGRGVVERCQGLGYDTYYFSRSEKPDSRVPSQRPYHYSTHIEVDLNSTGNIMGGFKQYDKHESSLDILVNVAGINYCKYHEQISNIEWDEVLNVNLRSFFITCREAIKRMHNGGKIVNVSSIAGRNKSIVSGVHYTASKAGIIGLTRQLAHEVNDVNINCVCPSQTLTEMLDESMNEKQKKELASKIPLGRLAEVREIVDPIMFLLSDQASYIHGTCLDVNGGQL